MSREDSHPLSLKDKLLSKKTVNKKDSQQQSIFSLKTKNYRKYTDFTLDERYQETQLIDELSKKYKIRSPFFRTHDGTASAITSIDHKECINFASYNYLNLSGHLKVSQAAKGAIDQYGTSVSASRIVSGEREPQQQLEQALAELYGVDDAVVFVSGHATNVTTIGYLLGEKDLILHDELAHNSIIEGAKLSGAKRMAFKHNDFAQLEKKLAAIRNQYQRVLIAIEGLYSMDGDFPNLPKFIELKEQYGALLMVDEAHSLGVMGQMGRGIAEHFQVDPKRVDIWMGTLSKTLASCGGFIAGKKEMIELLRYKCPGFLYSVGIPCANAASSYQALQIMLEEPERVQKLQSISRYFLAQAQKMGFDTGKSQGIGVNVIMIGSSRKAAELSDKLLQEGINVQPVIYPAVEPKAARLRFFMSCEHINEQVDIIFGVLKKYL